ncbi:M23 family metallopeptidase [uncultured Methylobacterium sp.]|uniref:M23 family metallopeptidase n=1 Tax=uncultured Methylobacterium sp. TaxID=157278 RepID=UPI0035CCA333
MRFPSIPGTRLRAALASLGGIRILAAGFVVTSLWAGATTWYLVFRDELLARFVAQQGAMQYGYEERIGVLRTQIDRAAIERLSASDGVEVRLTELAQRQAAMEKRHAMLSALTGAPTVPEVATAAAPAAKRPTPSGKPVPSPDALELRSRDEESPEALGRRSARDLPVTIAALEARLDGIAAAQTRSLERIAQRAGHTAQRLRGLVANTGLDAARFERPSAAGLGGPLVPIVIDPFGIAFVEAQRALADEDRMRRVADGLPLRQPLAGSFSQSSQFGPRLDPFTRGLALHTGIDMKADAGDPARATAAGRVVAAEYAGGYGNMVEIDHGHGVTTRYAHLSAFAVQSGQTVEAGSLVGRVGSTGRSTGSHLHYETRIDGEPVDPQRFLRAGTAGR